MARATAQASELDAAELRVGGERLLALVTERRPAILAIAGVTAYRKAFGHPRADIGPQPGPLGPQPGPLGAPGAPGAPGGSRRLPAAPASGCCPTPVA